MTKYSFAAAFAVGLAALAWIAAGFIGSSAIPLAVTAAILGVYLFGAFELKQFRAATQALRTALRDLTQAPERLADWLGHVPPSLRESVRLRVEGARSPLPGPALTPYLVGLLVMLGMLGTFLGMVLTFRGAVFVLEGSSDLNAIRAALAAPIKGLGLSFGTSVAGVATSAMLGLMSAIARRERLVAVRELDARIAGVLQPFSLVHQQARALPQVVEALQALMASIEQRTKQLDEQLLARHGELQREVTQAYDTLAGRVGSTLEHSLVQGTKAAGDALRPVVEGAMAQVVGESQKLHERLAGVAQEQVELLSKQFAQEREQQRASEEQRLRAWTASLESLGSALQKQWQATQDEAATLLRETQSLAQARAQSEAVWDRQHRQRLDEVAQLWRTELTALREQEQGRGDAAVARLGELQSAVAQHLADLGAALEAPITRLLHTASEVPQAAAGVIGQLRSEMSRMAERDNVTLEERTALLAKLRDLMQSVQQAADGQRAATEALVASASSVLTQAGTQADAAAERVATSAGEFTRLAESFQQGVQGFQASNDKLVASLSSIEAALERSTARSDEQLAYYVAQAREVIDLSIASQQAVVEHLRPAPAKPAKPAPQPEQASA
ncbi:hypothetical protein JJB11_13510 [Ramlibacter ginsenosidimutans]|uniref:DUF802 domain-containing protein n=1 Tax=Ramlibacter ginsenosidimutans TaxID=502333 RepID=A0A934WND7_9BURK|nr:hypothetical protein [Ramlibacter ginsenosidimutans]MBK6007112.1 hypothetical protein [Ramlibacter ginsenosidimutans]